MAEAEAAGKSYPYISANVWNELRIRFQKSIPQKVTPSYLQSALGFNTEKAAKNLLPQLRTIGLIDADGTPTDLARKYRMDAEYLESAQEIVGKVYPSELRDLYPGPSESATDVANWFMRSTGGGQASAGMQARFYLALVSGQLPTVDRAVKASAADSQTPRVRRTRIAPATQSARPAKATESAEAKEQYVAPSKPTTVRPNLHVDVQVHISADASLEQIDAVFASMAKHLYGSE